MKMFFYAVLFFAFSANAADPVFEIGFSKEIITPDSKLINAGSICMGGYAPFRTATGVNSDLYARSIVISETTGKKNTLIITNLDLPGIGNQSLARIRDAVKTATKVPEENILIGATHNHSGPDLQGLWGGVSDDYIKDLEFKTAQAIVDAFNKREKAYLYVSKGTHSNNNRRGWTVSDHEMTVLQAVTVKGKKVLGTLVNFAAHPVLEDATNTLLSRDFPGHVVDTMEAKLGGVSLYVNGIVGDVTPGHSENGFAGAKSYGESIATAAIATLPNKVKIQPAEIGFQTEVLLQKVGNNTFSTAYWLGWLKYDAEEGDWLSVSFKVRNTSFRLGKQVQAVAFPGESLSRNGMPIKDEMKADYRLFLGLTGDTLGYFVPTDEWNKDPANKKYEETISMHRDVGDRVRDTMLKLIRLDNTLF